MSAFERSFRVFTFAAGMGVLAPTARALAQEGECTIKCERCVVDVKTGQADCSNCTITGCTIEFD